MQFSLSYSPLALPKISLVFKISLCFQRLLFWELAFLVLVPWAGMPNVGLDPSLLREEVHVL